MFSVSGSRNYDNKKIVFMTLASFKKDIKIIHVGDCKTGVDLLTVQWCENNFIPCKIFKAEWDKYRKSAGPLRNKQLIEGTNCLIAFPEKDSKGTRSSINIARKLGIQTIVFEV